MLMSMPDDDSHPADASEEKAVVVTDEMPELFSDAPVVSSDATPVALVEPETLTQGLRLVRHRIPDFVQLSKEEEQAMTRIASLDREFLEEGLRAAEAWDESKLFLGASGGELRQNYNTARRWDVTESEFDAILKGLRSTNRKRWYTLGKIILRLYRILRESIDMEGRQHLRPYYEAMQRAYMKRKRKRKSAKTEKPDKGEGD